MFQSLNYKTKGSVVTAPIKREFWNFRVPVNSNLLNCSGACLAVCLLLQLLTGSLLAIHYVATSEEAFDSVRRIIVDLQYGDMIRFFHSNGASFFFILIYIHVGKAIYYGSYTGRYKLLWNSGISILILLMATAFTGYVLPWGQMSFWAATVVINFFTAIPVFGSDITHFIWGDVVPSTITLQRFQLFHYVLPWILLLFAIKHILLLHKLSGNGDNSCRHADTVPFFPHYFWKDAQAILVMLMLLTHVVAHYPTFFLNPINFWKANPMVTPKAIVPEWYFLPFYGILRAIKNKALGVILMFFSIFILALLPYMHSALTAPLNSKIFGQIVFSLFIVDFILLGVGASKPYIPELDTFNYILVTYYFLFFFSLTYIDWVDTHLKDFIKYIRKKIKPCKLPIPYSRWFANLLWDRGHSHYRKHGTPNRKYWPPFSSTWTVNQIRRMKRLMKKYNTRDPRNFQQAIKNYVTRRNTMKRIFSELLNKTHLYDYVKYKKESKSDRTLKQGYFAPSLRNPAYRKKGDPLHGAPLPLSKLASYRRRMKQTKKN